MTESTERDAAHEPEREAARASERDAARQPERDAAREQLSALADGEVGDAQAAESCQHWRSDPELRATWHAYQLIGDALRSEDLCAEPSRDLDFVVALRARLADEPVVLARHPLAGNRDRDIAPLPLAATSRRRAWRTPVAVAAGFVAVIGVVVATRLPTTGSDGPSVARSTGIPAQVATARADTVPVPTVAATPAAVADARPSVASGQLIRDVRLDRYLSAHKQFAGSSALGVPSGFLRNATADAADR